MSAGTNAAPACWNCAHWAKDQPPIATGSRWPDGSNPALGVCQLLPPIVVIVGPERSAVSMFPPVHGDRLCGKWESVFDVPDGGSREPASVIELAARRQAA